MFDERIYIFDGDKLRIEIKDSITRVFKNIYAFDGLKATDLNYDMQGKPIEASIRIGKSRDNTVVDLGRVSQYISYPFAVKYKNKEFIGEEECVVIEVDLPPGGTETKAEVWIIPAKGFVAAKIKSFDQSLNLIREIVYEGFKLYAKNIWYPEKSIDTLYNYQHGSGNILQRISRIVEQAEFNIPISPIMFQLELPQGIWVTDFCFAYPLIYKMEEGPIINQ